MSKERCAKYKYIHFPFRSSFFSFEIQPPGHIFVLQIESDKTHWSNLTSSKQQYIQIPKKTKSQYQQFGLAKMAMLMETLRFIKSHWTSLPYPTHQFTGQTIVVTGSNVGMGLEAARHFVRLEAAKVILAVRTISKGENAKSSIETSEKRPGVVEVWELDLASYASVKAFAAKAQGLDRLDVVVENAGMYAFDFQMAEENERTITVNVVSQFFLGLLLLPKLRETSLRFEKETVLTFTGSFVYWLTKFPERKSEHVFDELAKKETARIADR